MRVYVISLSSLLLSVACAAGAVHGGVHSSGTQSPSMQLTHLMLAGCGVLGCWAGLWIALSYAALIHPTRASPLVRLAATFGTPTVRRTLAALTVVGATALPAHADTGDLGWGAPEEPGGGSAQSVVVAPHSHTVRPGESLWSIARNSLEPGASAADIAAASEQWFRENRETIADPDLIFPGQTLHSPQELP